MAFRLEIQKKSGRQSRNVKLCKEVMDKWLFDFNFIHFGYRHFGNVNCVEK